MVLADSRNALSDQRARAHTHFTDIVYCFMCLYVCALHRSFVCRRRRGVDASKEKEHDTRLMAVHLKICVTAAWCVEAKLTEALLNMLYEAMHTRVPCRPIVTSGH